MDPAVLDDIKQDAKARMGKSIDALDKELRHLRTGRASSALVDGIKVPYYGSEVPLSQVGNVAVSDSRTLTITLWEKAMVGPAEKAILGSDLGITPNTAGTVIRLNLPPLTEERRRELSRHVAHEGENSKIAIRNIRRDALQTIKDLRKEKEITEDDERRGEDEIQQLTDHFVTKVDEVVKAKEDELMTV